MPRKSASPTSTHTPVDAYKHEQTRRNIPTKETSRFMAEDEAAPKEMLYPRDPSIDPQLVWKGKDEQDRQDLAVPTVPVYIQEKLHPRVIIENLRKTAKEGELEPELTLFSDFNGLNDFQKELEFYRHDKHWTNRMILGDSLLVMNSLAEKEGMKGQVQCIYIDPPYGIKFGSNWQTSTRKRDVKDGKAEDMSREPEQIKAFRDTWELGIHSYLSYLRDRLVVAYALLNETGSVFVQIGDENVHLVRNILDEVFGAENFVTELIVKKTGSQSGDLIQGVNDYICWYAKDIGKTKFRSVYQERPERDEDDFSADPLTSSGESPNGTFEFKFEGRKFHPGKGAHWKTGREGLTKLVLANRITAQKTQIRFKKYFSDFPVKPITNLWTDLGGAADMVYVVQTNHKMVQRCILMTTDPGDLVLDPTCGSGTTAYVAEQWGRRWITCDTSRVALMLARQRLMSAKYPYYLLADSKEGLKKEAELTGIVSPDYDTKNDVRKGFVYDRVQHITLKSIANNPDIKEDMTREQIDAAIARHADVELLVDKPFEDKKKLRVAGPFTVESLSPHRVLAPGAERPESELEGQKDDASGDFSTLVLDNLKRNGISNTKKGERLKFDTLSAFPGRWLQLAGEYTDASGESKRVAVSIGPEYGTITPDQMKEAAKEATKGLGFDLLVLCGYAFDPYISEESRNYGKLTILPVRMNADLTMGDELLKKTGAGNLFTVFGEPDMVINKLSDGRIEVEIKGLDIYDPTSGEIRSSNTDDLACWFIDTDYNDESFFVRHAYFSGAGDPYEKLRKALKAEINPEAWESLYRTTSQPFDRPKSGKVAIKVINHYGDEALKVFEV
jgi:adenine-specific DNA-methyltransferase